MKKKNVTKDQLAPFAKTTDSGVAEVIRKQEAGWSYIKSGVRRRYTSQSHHPKGEHAR